MLATGDESRPSQDTVLLCVVLLCLDVTLPPQSVDKGGLLTQATTCSHPLDSEVVFYFTFSGFFLQR